MMAPLTLFEPESEPHARRCKAKRFSALIAGVLAAVSLVLAAGCSGGGTPGPSAQTQSVSDLISAVTVDVRGPSLFEPFALPTGPAAAPALLRSTIFQPDASHPDGQIELDVSVLGYSPALIAAAGYGGYIQAPFLGDMATAVRSITPTSFSPGQMLHVNIQVSNSAQPSAVSVTDSPPAGWSVSNVSSGGSFDSTSGQITWTFAAGAFPPAVSCDVTAPANATSTVSFVGYIFAESTAVHTQLLGGAQVVMPAGSRAASFVSAVGVSPAGAAELTRMATKSAPPPPNETIDLSPTVPAAQFNADLLIVEDTSVGLTLPLTVHIRNGVGTSVAPATFGSGE